MTPDIRVVIESELGRVSTYRCRCGRADLSELEYTRAPVVTFTRRGGFTYHLGSRVSNIHGGVVLVEKAGTEYAVSHPRGFGDECTMLELSDRAVEAFGESGGLFPGTDRLFPDGCPALVLPAAPRLEYLHRALLFPGCPTGSRCRLKAETLLAELIREIGDASRTEGSRPTASTAKLGTEAADRAKEFIARNFMEDVSLSEIARHADASVFHFSRLFKRATGRSPHQYLLDIRLEHAALHLGNTSLSVTEICFASGFNSLEHFISTFTRRFSVSPSKYRHGGRH